MSFEGYREYKCKCGNIDALDVYDAEPLACGECGGCYSEIRTIDLTNGYETLPWREVEFRPEFGDYVAKGYWKRRL